MSNLNEILEKIRALKTQNENYCTTTKYNDVGTMYEELQAQYIVSKLRTGIKSAISEKRIDEDLQYQDSVQCPNCFQGSDAEFSHMHHIGIETFSGKEDHVNEHIIIAGGGIDMPEPNIMVDDNVDQNPSSRRGGILIHFKCEDCDTIQTMQIGQHQGVSLFGWMK